MYIALALCSRYLMQQKGSCYYCYSGSTINNSLTRAKCADKAILKMLRSSVRNAPVALGASAAPATQSTPDVSAIEPVVPTKGRKENAASALPQAGLLKEKAAFLSHSTYASSPTAYSFSYLTKFY